MTLAQVLGQIAIFIAVAFLCLWLLRRRATVLKALGDVVFIIASSLVVLLSIHVPRWGVFRWGSETDLYPASVIRLVYIVLIGTFMPAGARTSRGASVSRRADPTQGTVTLDPRQEPWP